MEDKNQNSQTRRERMRSGVIMPDNREEPVMHVDGTKEYRRNAMLMVFGGIFLLIATLAVLIFASRFYYVVFFLGLGLIGMGAKRLLESIRDTTTESGSGS